MCLDLGEGGKGFSVIDERELESGTVARHEVVSRVNLKLSRGVDILGSDSAGKLGGP